MIVRHHTEARIKGHLRHKHKVRHQVIHHLKIKHPTSLKPKTGGK
jgi:hypothetical protein